MSWRGFGSRAKAGDLSPAVSEIFFVTIAVDDTADNDYTTELAEIWHNSGAAIAGFEFDEAADIPHNSVDPAAERSKKRWSTPRFLSCWVRSLCHNRSETGLAANLHMTIVR